MSKHWVLLRSAASQLPIVQLAKFLPNNYDHIYTLPDDDWLGGRGASKWAVVGRREKNKKVVQPNNWPLTEYTHILLNNWLNWIDWKTPNSTTNWDHSLLAKLFLPHPSLSLFKLAPYDHFFCLQSQQISASSFRWAHEPVNMLSWLNIFAAH